MIFQTNHLSKFICKAILRCAKSFLGKSELLSAYKAFIHNTMEYCTLLCRGTPASHLALIDAKESKALKLIGMKPSVSDCSCSHSLCIPPLDHLLCGLTPSALSWLCPSKVSAERTWSASKPSLPQSFESHSFLQDFKKAVQHHFRSTSIETHDHFHPH